MRRDRTTFIRRSTRLLLASTMLLGSGAALAQDDRRPPTAQRPAQPRRSAEDSDDDHRHRANAARKISRTSRSRSPRSRTKTLDDLQVDKFEDYARLVPSLSFKSGGGGGARAGPARQRLFPRRRLGRERQPLDLAAQRRHLSRRTADHDHHRRARRPCLRHRAHRGARRAAGHALRRLEPGRHDPHHHQQARHSRHLWRGQPRS